MNNISISLGKRQLADSIWKSAGIEGLGTTFTNTECILENLPVQTTQEEVFFIVNMKRAWEFLFDNIEYPNNLMFLREINKIVMQNLSYISGELRELPVTIGGTSWTPDMPQEGVIIRDLKRINGILSIPYNKIPDFKKLLVSFYESNDSSELKQFFREKCLLLNPDYLPETQKTDNDSMDEHEI